MKKSKKNKQSYIVEVEVTSIKELVCENCTKEEACANPWLYSVDEREIEQLDWVVRDVEENV